MLLPVAPFNHAKTIQRSVLFLQEKCDLYSLGMLYIELVIGKTYRGDSEDAQRNAEEKEAQTCLLQVYGDGDGHLSVVVFLEGFLDVIGVPGF